MTSALSFIKFLLSGCSDEPPASKVAQFEVNDGLVLLKSSKGAVEGAMMALRVDWVPPLGALMLEGWLTEGLRVVHLHRTEPYPAAELARWAETRSLTPAASAAASSRVVHMTESLHPKKVDRFVVLQLIRKGETAQLRDTLAALSEDFCDTQNGALSTSDEDLQAIARLFVEGLPEGLSMSATYAGDSAQDPVPSLEAVLSSVRQTVPGTSWSWMSFRPKDTSKPIKHVPRRGIADEQLGTSALNNIALRIAGGTLNSSSAVNDLFVFQSAWRNIGFGTSDTSKAFGIQRHIDSAERVGYTFHSPQKPYATPRKPQGPISIPLLKDNGEVVSFVPFQNSVMHNLLLAGVCRTGKTVLCRELVQAALAQKATVRVVGRPQEYEGLARLYGVEVRTITDTSTGLNPLALVHSRDTFQRTLPLLVEWLCLLVGRHGLYPDLTYTLFESALRQAWDRKDLYWSLEGIQHLIRAFSSPAADMLADGLEHCVHTGSLAKLFSGPVQPEGQLSIVSVEHSLHQDVSSLVEATYLLVQLLQADERLSREGPASAGSYIISDGRMTEDLFRSRFFGLLALSTRKAHAGLVASVQQIDSGDVPMALSFFSKSFTTSEVSHRLYIRGFYGPDGRPLGRLGVTSNNGNLQVRAWMDLEQGVPTAVTLTLGADELRALA